jgi:bifunctional DNase/RNase
MNKIALEIVGMSYSQSQSGSYALILGESGGKRRLPIIIGGFEAQAIALGLEKIQPSRPMTHDLLKNMLFFYGIEVIEVIIHKFNEGVFHALLVCRQDDEISEIDARTSDAVAIAIRFECPIYTYQHILTEAGITLEASEDPSPDTIIEDEPEENEFSEYLLTELETMLQQAIEQEEFEKASLIRDEIQKRKKKF